jgi:hypothetical protein
MGHPPVEKPTFGRYVFSSGKNSGGFAIVQTKTHSAGGGPIIRRKYPYLSGGLNEEYFPRFFKFSKFRRNPYFEEKPIFSGG